MENNIIVKITGESDLDKAQIQLLDYAEAGRELQKELTELSKAEKAEVDKIKEMGLKQEQLAVELEKTASAYGKEKKRIQERIVANKKNTETIKQSIKEYQKEVAVKKKVEKEDKKMVARLRELREQMQKLEEAGEGTSDEFVKLAVEASQLQDAIGDIQQRIAILASDTLNLDAAMSAGSGLAGAFNTATSAMALFGGESEALEQAFYKVQSVLSVLNGLQEVSNTLNKDSAINVAISTKMSNLHAVAMAKEAVAAGTATKAQKMLNFVMKMNPFGLILAAITALVSVFMIFSDNFEIFGKKLRGIADAVLGFFSDSYAAGRKAELALKAYELQAVKTSTALDKMAQAHEKAMRGIEDAEREQMNANAKNHATTIKNYKDELEFLKQKRKETIEYTNKAIEENNKLQESANEAYLAAVNELSKRKEGTEKYKEALEKVNDTQQTMNNIYQKGIELANQRTAARQAVVEKEQQIADEEINRERQRQQAVIDIMKEGVNKEKEQVQLSYRQQLQEAGKGTALWKALKAKENKELQDIDKKYNYNTQQLRIDVMRDGLDKELAQLELNYSQQLATMQKGTDLYNATLEKKKKEEQEIRSKYNAQALAEYAEQLRLESEADQFNYDKKEDYYKADAVAKVAALNKMEMSEEAYANAVKEIEQELNRNLKDLTEQRLSDTTRALQRELTRAEDALNGQLFGSAKVDALKKYYDAQIALYDAQEAETEKQYANGTISWQDYQDKLLEIEMNRANAARDLETGTAEAIMDAYSKITDHLMEWFSVASDIANSAIQAQMDKLDEMYTTDAEEAKKDANKKYITEKELDAKKRALQARQARIAKAQAIFEIGLSIPKAIMETIAEFGAPVPPNVLGITAVALVSALGAAQLAAAMAKPLAQYAKGRKGGPGEMALVGEKGPEIMYVPQGASIIPNHKIDKPDAWGAYGVPRLNIPERPDINSIMSQAYGIERGTIDYDKLGKAVAANMPKMTPVSVNVDRNGVTITDGRDTRTYLNTKYQGSWN